MFRNFNVDLYAGSPKHLDLLSRYFWVSLRLEYSCFKEKLTQRLVVVDWKHFCHVLCGFSRMPSAAHLPSGGRSLGSWPLVRDVRPSRRLSSEPPIARSSPHRTLPNGAFRQLPVSGNWQRMRENKATLYPSLLELSLSTV